MSHNRKLFAIVFAVQEGKGCFHGCILALLPLLKQTGIFLLLLSTHRQQWTLSYSSTSYSPGLVYLFPLNLNTFCRTGEYLPPSSCCASCNVRKQSKLVGFPFQRLILMYHSLMRDPTCVVCCNFSFSKI